MRQQWGVQIPACAVPTGQAWRSVGYKERAPFSSFLALPSLLSLFQLLGWSRCPSEITPTPHLPGIPTFFSLMRRIAVAIVGGLVL